MLSNSYDPERAEKRHTECSASPVEEVMEHLDSEKARA